jgi:hypothetical protein
MKHKHNANIADIADNANIAGNAESARERQELEGGDLFPRRTQRPQKEPHAKTQRRQGLLGRTSRFCF